MRNDKVINRRILKIIIIKKIIFSSNFHIFLLCNERLSNHLNFSCHFKDFLKTSGFLLFLSRNLYTIDWVLVSSTIVWSPWSLNYWPIPLCVPSHCCLIPIVLTFLSNLDAYFHFLLLIQLSFFSNYFFKLLMVLYLHH